MTYRRPTPAQIRAQNRNWRIFRLRGLRAQVHLLTKWRLRLALWLIDRELIAMGATVEPKRPWNGGRFNPSTFDIDLNEQELPF